MAEQSAGSNGNGHGPSWRWIAIVALSIALTLVSTLWKGAVDRAAQSERSAQADHDILTKQGEKIEAVKIEVGEVKTELRKQNDKADERWERLTQELNIKRTPVFGRQ